MKKKPIVEILGDIFLTAEKQGHKMSGLINKNDLLVAKCMDKKCDLSFVIENHNGDLIASGGALTKKHGHHKRKKNV